MKKILFLIFFQTIIGYSQQDSQGLSLVNYTFDLNIFNFTEGIPYKSKLFFNDSTSLFIYNNMYIEGVTGFFKKVGDRSGRVDGVHFFRDFDEIGNRFYLEFSTNKLTCRELIRDEYEVIVEDSNIDFNWEITNETKQIGKYTCHKATTKNFRGRNYEAWFTYDIPVPTGPWKFHGLPGLILEVHDDKDLVNITFNSIIDDTSEKVNYQMPVSNEIISLEEYLNECFRLYLSYVDNRKAMIATGQMRKSSPSKYKNLEYNEEQIKLLDQYNQIDYITYEEALKDKD